MSICSDSQIFCHWKLYFALPYCLYFHHVIHLLFLHKFVCWGAEISPSLRWLFYLFSSHNLKVHFCHLLQQFWFFQREENHDINSPGSIEYRRGIEEVWKWQQKRRINTYQLHSKNVKIKQSNKTKKGQWQDWKKHNNHHSPSFKFTNFK